MELDYNRVLSGRTVPSCNPSYCSNNQIPFAFHLGTGLVPCLPNNLNDHFEKNLFENSLMPHLTQQLRKGLALPFSIRQRVVVLAILLRCLSHIHAPPNQERSDYGYYSYFCDEYPKLLFLIHKSIFVHAANSGF
ncbi:unnamed protein product [Microthlaspi erraticum]|uniref:Uncharacterized protein n=1 Tax=Microthlaspi erraticum TaxID=1685480 RepID=A0A6D2L8Q1_9BRAS|nr:unnamed protein product [Microthlaspi erraticum]